MRTQHNPIDTLRRAIDCLPVQTRNAMLEGISKNEIIVGAYSDRDGGVCPMLAAHRCGGRTNFISFAKAWDAFAGVKRARRATERELRVLCSQLHDSLAQEQDCPPSNLGQAIQAHQVTARRRRSDEAVSIPPLSQAIQDHQATARDRRAREAAETGGWGFLRDRREDRDAERALERFERELGHQDERERERELV